MYDFLRILISEPVYAFLAVIAVWLILYLLLIKVVKPKPMTWARLEYIWILIGTFGVLTLVSENNRLFKQNEVADYEQWILTGYRGLDSDLNGGRICVQFNRAFFSEQEAFDRLQSRADSICTWAEEVKSIFNDLEPNNFQKIDIPELKVSKPETDYEYRTITTAIATINTQVEKRNDLLKQIESSDGWKAFFQTTGILFVIVAFGLRLTLVSYKVTELKIQSKTGIQKKAGKSSKIGPGYWVLIFSALTIAIFVIIFKVFSTSTLGLFGDFYGGVIATVASIFAGVYLYQTFSNSKKESDFQIINKMFDNIVNDINNIQFRTQYDKDWKELPVEKRNFYTGVDAIYNFDSLLRTNPNSVLNHLSFILNSFENIIYMAHKVRYKYDDMKEITLRRIYYLYYSHILWSVWELEFPHKKRTNAVKGLLSSLSKENLHDDSKFTVDKYAKLSIETIKFLSDDKRKLVEKKPEVISDLEKLKM